MNCRMGARRGAGSEIGRGYYARSSAGKRLMRSHERWRDRAARVLNYVCGLFL